MGVLFNADAYGDLSDAPAMMGLPHSSVRWLQRL